MRTVIIPFRHKHLGRAAQIAIVRGGWINEFLRGADTVFLEHHYQHLRVHDRTGVKQFHEVNLC